jgi:hypothetical protein
MSQRSRVRNQSILGGFFSQKNAGFAAQRIAKENLLKMTQNQAVERNKTAYNTALEDSKTSAAQVQSIRAAGGTDASGKLNNVGAQLELQKLHPNWATMAPRAREALTTRFMGMNGGKTAEEFYGHKGTPAFDDFSFIPADVGEFRAVQAKTNNMVQEVGTPDTPAPAEITGIPEVPTVPEDPIDLFPVSPRKIHGNGFTSTDPKTGQKTLNFVDEAGKVLATHEIGKDVQQLSQTNRTYVNDSGELVTALFDKEDKRGIFFLNENGSRNYEVTPETDEDAKDRVLRTASSAQQRELFSNAMAGVASADQLLTGRNAANLGVQGMWNQFAEFASTLVNPFQTVAEGRELTKEVKEALGVPVDLTGAEALEAAKGRQKSILRKLTLDNLGFATAATDEERSEIQALANKAATDVRMASLVYYAAKTFRGAGKLNTDDLARIDRIVSASSGEGSFQGGVREIQADLYERAKRMSGTLINSKWAGVGNRIQNGVLFKDPQGARAPGFLYEVIRPGIEEPEVVFLNTDTGGSTGLTIDQALAFTETMVKVPAPSRIAPQR